MRCAYADSLIDQRREEGRSEGRSEGREEGASISLRAFAQQLLTRQFGDLPETTAQALAGADLDTLNKWGLSAAPRTRWRKSE